jgi:hypothetical protein
MGDFMRNAFIEMHVAAAVNVKENYRFSPMKSLTTCYFPRSGNGVVVQMLAIHPLLIARRSMRLVELSLVAFSRLICT